MKKSILTCALGLFTLASCQQQSKTSQEANDADSIKLDAITVSLGDVSFTHTNSKSAIISDGQTITINAAEQTDLFCDPKQVGTKLDAPMLLKQIDNTKPFTLTTVVSPQFTAEGTYDAGGLIVFSDSHLWQKLCYEQDERGMHRIVTVKTNGSSDDNNHEPLTADSVYLKISSDAKVLGCYFSIDGETWQLVKGYENNYPEQFYIGISGQCPKGKGHTAVFSTAKWEDKAVSNFRTGI